MANAAYWLVPHGWLSLLSYTPEHLPGGGSTHNGVDPPTPTTNQENVPQAGRDGGIFSPLMFFLPKDSSLCKVDMKPAQSLFFLLLLLFSLLIYLLG